MSENAQLLWEKYCEQEMTAVAPLLASLGFALELNQPQIGGERFLMQAVTTKNGRKLILFARRASDNKRVVIKITRDKNGRGELLHERKCRAALQNITFAYIIFLSPKEILFANKGGYTISIQEYVEQECPFLERALEEQFSTILKAFEAQEGAHATTFGHLRSIIKTFGKINAPQYLESYQDFQKNISQHSFTDEHTRALLQKGYEILTSQKETVEQYCDFLTHTDFVPHNFRIIDENIYLLDHSSIRFGNKYEGWARFLNFMTLYNPKLEEALLFYVRNNRADEELVSLKLMRIYKLGELIWYHTKKLDKASGNFRTLTEKRVIFWSNVLEAILNDTLVSQEITDKYKSERDALRSPDETERQKGLH
ncbi:MAG: hypothetical protein WC587_02215 [Candidatus Paceibacterota bacterium]